VANTTKAEVKAKRDFFGNVIPEKKKDTHIAKDAWPALAAAYGFKTDVDDVDSATVGIKSPTAMKVARQIVSGTNPDAVTVAAAMDRQTIMQAAQSLGENAPREIAKAIAPEPPRPRMPGIDGPAPPSFA
jgi:hypothetical protein